jgi:hypothetical protein
MSKVIPMPLKNAAPTRDTPKNETSARPPPVQPARKPKWGAGSFSAWMRQGLKELRSLIYPQSPHSRDAELGLWGTSTPHEVWNSRNQKPAITPPAKENKAMNSPNQNTPEQEPAPAHTSMEDRIAQALAEQQHQPQQEMEHEKE